MSTHNSAYKALTNKVIALAVSIIVDKFITIT